MFLLHTGGVGTLLFAHGTSVLWLCFGFSMLASSCCCYPTARCIISTGAGTAQEQLPFYWSDVDGATA